MLSRIVHRRHASANTRHKITAHRRRRRLLNGQHIFDTEPRAELSLEQRPIKLQLRSKAFSIANVATLRASLPNFATGFGRLNAAISAGMRPKTNSLAPLSENIDAELFGQQVSVLCAGQEFQEAGVLWPANWLLEDSIRALGVDLNGSRVLELGCGTAVLSVALAKSGAHVWATDLPRVAELVKRTALANHLEVSQFDGNVYCGVEGSLQFYPLRWGESLLPPGAFDLVLGCEVLYFGGWDIFEDDPCAGLLRVLITVCKTDAQAIIVGMSRELGREQSFFADCEAAGLRVAALGQFSLEEGQPYAFKLCGK